MSEHDEQIPSSWGRVQPTLRTMLAGGVFVGAFLYIAQLTFPEGYKPSEVMGDAAGLFMEHEVRARTDALVDQTRRVGDAQTQQASKGQLDVFIVQTAMQHQAANLAGQGVVAVVSDVLCLGARAVEANTQPTVNVGWNRPKADIDWHGGAQTMARATCGIGDDLRQGVQASLLATGRQAAASRGMSLTDGAHAPLRVADAEPVPVARSKPTLADLAAVMTNSRASRHYDAAVLAQAETVAAIMPQEVRVHLRDGAAATDDDVFVERVIGVLKIAMALRD